jgi:hypothetical protein
MANPHRTAKLKPILAIGDDAFCSDIPGAPHVNYFKTNFIIAPGGGVIRISSVTEK